jgi:CHAT domain-containing protein/Tfp pilus assembly protein PilF
MLFLSGQCPDRAFLWNRIISLRDSQVPAADQLRELKTDLAKIADCPYKNDSTHVLLLSRIGWLYSMQNDFKTAIAYTNRSIDMIHSHIGAQNIRESQLIRCYNNLRILYDSTNQQLLKKRAIDSCISLVVRLKTDYRYAFNYVNLKIENYFEEGDYFNCINYSNLGEFIAEKSGNLEDDALFYKSWKLNSLIYLKQYQEASELLEISLQKCLQTGNKKYIGSLLGIKARIAADNGHAAEAIKSTQRSIYYDKAISNYNGCAGSLINLGYYLYFKKLNQYQEALTTFDEALKYANDDYSVEILDNMATVYVEMGEYEKAFSYFQKSFDKIYPGADELNILNKSGEDILNRVSADYIVSLLLNKAEALIKRYKQNKKSDDLSQALNLYISADHLMDKIKMVQTEYATKLFWRTNTRRLYEHAIETCYLSGNMNDAFYFFEKSKAVLLNDQLKEQETGDPNITEMAIIKRKINGFENRVHSLDPASNEYADLQRDLYINKEELSHLDQLIKTKNPWYYQSLLDTSFTSLKEVQNKLLSNKGANAILEFFNGDSAVYLFSISPDHAKITRINKTGFEKLVDRYNQFLADPALEIQDFTGFIKTGQDLYQLIFKGSSAPSGRIIISPDGKYFPMEALVTNNNLSQPVYFLNDHTVSYTYSIRFLLNEFTANKTASTGSFLGVAPVKFPAALNLTSLFQSDVSLDNISANFGNAKTLVGLQASKNNFMQQFETYKIIQLYTHASDTSSNGEPVIFFADSALYLSELIPENKNVAQLIVLSACETGNGKLYKGEGVFSFNRGFAALGIPSAVINLWSVENQSTYKITEMFYKYTAKGLPLDEALQKAKLEFIAGSSKEKRLPFYWAAAVLVGKTDAVDVSTGYQWKWIALMGVTIFITLVYFGIKRKKTDNIHIGS